MQSHKILKIASNNSFLQNTLSSGLGISKILAQLLINRGINNSEEAKEFLNTRLDHLLDPYSFLEMQKAVSLIKKAAINKERIMVFSDYDVDGVTALVLLKTALSKIGAKASHYLPHRIKEGYGLNKNILQIAKQKNIKLLITADCGTNNHEQVEELRRHNIEVIITDHHEPVNHDAVSSASALINPKVKNSRYKYKDLAGVGVAYKLCQAITGSMLFEDLDLVSLGTIADVVPLTGENRVLVREGLARLSKTERIGLKALMKSSGIKDRKITCGFVSYILGPRINASGRIDTAETALNLLMSQKEEEAALLAQTIEKQNRERQKIENKILEEACDLINKEINFKEHRIIVLAKEGWHQGVLGIVASKLADRFYRPVIIISKTSDLCKGSGRSIRNFHLFHALLECNEFLKTFGGHSHAVGLVIAKENIEHFKKKINHLAKERLLFYDLVPSIDIDMELSLSDLDEEAISQLQALEPFGSGNPEPLFYSRNLKLKGESLALGRDTLKFWVTDGKVTYQAIGFGMVGYKETLEDAAHFDLVYTPRLDSWQEQDSVLLEVKDVSFR